MRKTTNPKNSWKRKGSIALLCLLSLGLTGCPWESDDLPPSSPSLRPVRSQQVKLRTQAPMKRFAGITESASAFYWGFYTSGTLKEIRVKAKDRVARGDVLALLDQQPLLSELSQARTVLARAEADFRNSESLFERVNTLLVDKKSSQKDVDAVRTSLERASAARIKALEKVEALEERLLLTEITSPDHCKVVRVMAAQNSLIKANQPIVELNCGDTLQIKIDVPESNILGVREGADATISFDALSGQSFQGQVHEIGPARPAGYTTFPVIIRLQDKVVGLRSGMSATVKLNVTKNTPALDHAFLIPLKSLLQEGDKTFVYLLKPHTSHDRGVVKRQFIIIGRILGNQVEVVEGVKESDRVITAGLQSIYDGLEVSLLPAHERGN